MRQAVKICLPAGEMTPRFKSLFGRPFLTGAVLFLFFSAIYLYAFPQANILYAGVVLAHAVVGLIASVYLLVLLFGLLRRGSWMSRLGWLLVAASAAFGMVLVKLGALRADYNLFYTHILLGLTGAGLLFADWAGRRGW